MSWSKSDTSATASGCRARSSSAGTPVKHSFCSVPALAAMPCVISLVQGQAIAALIVAGFTRQSATAAVNSGDMSQLVESPSAPPPGVVGRETATSREPVGGTPAPGAVAGQAGRPPQAGLPQKPPGATADALPRLTAKLPAASPPVPNGRK